MTANIGSGADWGRLNEIIDRERPDIVALQEVGQDWSETVLGPGWYWKHGAGTAIASRYPIVSTSQFPANGIDRWGDIAVIIVINLPQGNAKICCIHLNTPRWGLDELALTRYGLVGLDALRKNTRDRESESRNVRAWIADSEMPTIVAGDFNMPIESSIYRRYWSGFQNAFSVAGRGYGYSKYTRWHGVRIDHILVNQNWNVVSCHVAAPTGGDHQPVIADLRLSM
jgi:endonuclease/exonuclease/phosphatase family metal-dependent hydrolase